MVSPKTPNLNRPEELVFVNEVETVTAECQEIQEEEITKPLDSDTANAPPEAKEEKAVLGIRKESQKVKYFNF